MSNYLFIVHAARNTTLIDRWLAKYSTPSEIYTDRLGMHRLVIVSHDVKRSISGREYFRGTLVSPDHDSVVFGIAGWRSAPGGVRNDPGGHAGEYATATWVHRRLAIDRDVFGSGRIAYTEAAGLIAASDSLLTLASLRRAVGAPVTANREVLAARTARGAGAAQQVSPDTHVTEVSFVPAGRGIRQDALRLRWKLTGLTAADRIAAPTLNHTDALRASASDIGRVVATLAHVNAWHPRLSLSGGLDSRLVLAAAMHSGSVDQFTFHTAGRTKTNAVDHDIAKHLIATYDLAPTPQAPPTPAEAVSPLTLWGATLLGFYDGFGPNRTARPLPNTFALTGLGAELYKGQFGWKPFGELAKNADAGTQRAAIDAQFAKAAPSIGADPEARNATELLYFGYRNGIHGAEGHLGVHMTGIHPVMQLSLPRAGHQRVASSTGFAGSPDGIRDMTLLLSPQLVAEAYENTERNLTSEQVEERLRELGGLVPVPAPLTVYGSPDDVPDGPSTLSLTISREYGFVGNITPTPVLRVAEASLHLVDDDPELRPLYERVMRGAKWWLEESNNDIRANGINLPRILALELLRLTS